MEGQWTDSGQTDSYTRIHGQTDSHTRAMTDRHKAVNSIITALDRQTLTGSDMHTYTYKDRQQTHTGAGRHIQRHTHTHTHIRRQTE
jgi:hypothetical protein